MKRRYQALALVVASYIPVEVVSRVVTANAYANLYPPEADSISIPIFGAFFNAIVIAFVALVGLLLPARGWLGYVRMIPISVATLWSMSPVLYWMSPSHYWISASYLLPLSVLAYAIVCGLKSLKTHQRGTKSVVTSP